MFAPHDRPVTPQVRPRAARNRVPSQAGPSRRARWPAPVATFVLFLASMGALLLGATALLPNGLVLSPVVRAQTPAFPFTIQGMQFLRSSVPVFVNMIDYQPLEPGQAITDALRPARIQDDLRRFEAYQGGTDPILVRVYPQPTAALPVRVPKAFYDGIRALDFWVVRDIYFDPNYTAADAVTKGKAAIDAVIAEVESQGGLDRIFAWEIANEFAANTQPAITALEFFLDEMRDHIKARMAEPAHAGFSNWVTWTSWPPSDPLRTGCSPTPFAGCNPILTPSLDYYSFNAYSYDPERMRDHQAGPGTGTPFAGYLAALGARLPSKPIVVSESGLPNSPLAVGLDQDRLQPIYPSYRRGGLTPRQVAEGIADRYWDARLSGGVAGFGVFEWLDEWHKTGSPSAHATDPEEHFGLGGYNPGALTTLRYKLQQEVVHDLYTLTFPSVSPVISALTPGAASIAPAGNTSVQVTVSPSAALPVRYRWESSLGRIVGDGPVVQFHAGGVALGPATISVVAIDANHHATRLSTTIGVQAGSPQVEILTFGTSRSSGRVSNVNLSTHKVVLYLQTNTYYLQPFVDMPSVWVRADGYWWSTNFAGSPGAVLHAWVVPRSYVEPPTISSDPAGAIAHVSVGSYNDADNDLLPDPAEPAAAQDRYSDPDGDGAPHLDEFLAGRNLSVADNDLDGDGLRDDWERRFFGTGGYTGGQDPDGDGLTNAQEQARGTHPSRTDVDRDDDGLPDTWESARFGGLAPTGTDLEAPGVTTTDAYQLALSPTPPSITAQPLSRVVSPGLTAQLSVAAIGTPIFSFQWYQGTSPSTTNPIAGATSATFTTPAISSATSFWVRVSTKHGVVDSATATVTPTSIPCTYQLSSTSASVSPTGGVGAVQVTTANGCAWTAASAVSWVTITAGSSGVSSGVVAYAVQQNTAASRVGALTIGGQTFTVTQAAGGGSGATFTRYLSEGATSSFFDTLLALFNPGSAATTANMRFLRTGLPPLTHSVPVPAGARVTVDPKTIPGLEVSEFSTVVESDQLLVVDRTMSWDSSGYGAHSEGSVAAPSLLWYLAEGATHSGFGLFYLVQNANTSAATVRVRYLLPSGAPVERIYSIGPESRSTIWVNQIPELASTDVSAVIEVLNNQPVIVERAMYLSRAGQLFNAGHESAALPAPATSWYLAEGATGTYFDDFILVANPTATEALVRVTYLRPSGTPIVKTHTVAANTRFNIWVDLADPQLADTAVSAVVEATNGVPILVERAMWWPGDGTTWQEAHNSAGATSSATRWGIADGEVGGTRNVETYLLIALPSSTPTSVSVTLYFEDGTSAQRVFNMDGNSRFNVSVRDLFPAAIDRRFGAVVASLGSTPEPIIVERASYWDAGGARWAAGTNALATRLP